MEDSGREIVYLSVEQICEVNRQMIEEFGGLFVPPDNLLRLDSLEYILDAVKASAYGYDLYPTVKEKANAIAYRIISGHVFLDGNKRTAIHVAWEFLRGNGVNLILDTTIIELSVAVATGHATQYELLRWLHSHQ